MDHREINIAFVGAIVGVIVSAAILFAQNGTLSADIRSSADRVLPSSVQVAPRARILRNPAMTDITTTETTASGTAVEDRSSTPDCMVATAMTSGILKVIEDNAMSQATHDALSTALSTLKMVYCGTPQAALINNDCDKYGNPSSRYYTCMDEQAAGRVYNP